jgi:hypothetical protein
MSALSPAGNRLTNIPEAYRIRRTGTARAFRMFGRMRLRTVL